MNYIKIFIIFALVILTQNLFSQGNSNCSNPTPFCTSVPVNYPAAVNSGQAQGGTNYGCLGSTPNPAWFFLQMATSGPVSIHMSANSDIDFAAWGPFTSLTGACNNLNGNMVSNGGGNSGCSFSAANNETFSLANAVAGQFYVLLITNYSNQSQNINFSQTNASNPGAGTTNCGVVCGITLNNSGIICAGQSNLLTATTGTSITSYTLSGPGGIIATAPLPGTTNTFVNTVGGLQSTSIFTLAASTTAGTCQAVTTVNVIQYPSFTVTPATPTICQGGTYSASVSFSPGTNASSYGYNWSAIAPPGAFTTPVPGPGIYSPFLQGTVIGPGLINGSQAIINYTVTVTPLALNCPTTHTFDLVINNPLTPTLNIPPTICNTASSITLTAVPGGGTWTAIGSSSPALSSSGILSPGSPMRIGVDTLVYSAMAGTCVVRNTGTIQVSQFNSPALTSSISTRCSTLEPLYDLMTIVQTTVNGSWSGQNVFSNKFNPTGLPTGTYALTYSTGSSPNLSVCPASTVLAVRVFNPPTPVVLPISAMCNNASTVQLVGTPTIGGVWQNQGVVPLTGVLNPTLITSYGTNTVLYTSGEGTCTATGSQTFHVSEYRTAAFTGTIPNLCYNSNAFNLLPINQDARGAWSGPGVSVSNPGTSNQGYIFSTAGLATNNYTLTYSNASFPDPGLCSDLRTIVVSVLNPPVPSIAATGPYCNNGGPIQLAVTPSTGSWTPTSYLTSSGLFTPSLSPVGYNAVQYVIGTNTCNTSQTASISIEAYVPAIITSTIPDQCNTSSQVNLLPVTSNNLGSWSGPGVLGASFNPAVAGAGNIILTYNTASSPSGLCPAQTTIAVHVFSLAVPFFNTAGPFCNAGRPVKLGVSPVGGLFGGANTQAVDVTGLFNPAAAIIGNNIVNYSITSGPCVAYAQATIAVEQFVSADFIAEAGPFCQNDARRQLNMNTLVQNPGGIWSGSPALSGNIFTFVNANPGYNNVIHYTTNSASGLCPDTSDIRIRIVEIPTVVAKAEVLQNCSPVKVKLYTPTFETGEGSWNFGDGSDPEPGLKIDHTFTIPGSYNVVFTYSVASGLQFNCSAYATVSDLIKVYETPRADFSFSPGEIFISEPEVQLNNTSSVLGNNRYLWKVSGPNLEKTYNEVNPTVLFPQIGQYKVSLNATSVNGCKSDIVKLLDVKTEFNVYIPNSFTPNEDNLNETFKPVFSDYGLDEKNYEMQIFDRWGTLLFSTKDRNAGWDGTIQNKGIQPLKQDVYVYKIKYKDVDGNVYSKAGHVTIIR